MKTKSNVTSHTEWLRIAKLIQDKYTQMDRSVVDKKRLLVVLRAFEIIYDARATLNENYYYIGNLIQTGKIEGTREEIIGTVSEAIERTKRFISRSERISGRQASIFARNLVAILTLEEFSSDLGTLLAPHYETLYGLAGGEH